MRQVIQQRLKIDPCSIRADIFLRIIYPGRLDWVAGFVYLARRGEALGDGDHRRRVGVTGSGESHMSTLLRARWRGRVEIRRSNTPIIHHWISRLLLLQATCVPAQPILTVRGKSRPPIFLRSLLLLLLLLVLFILRSFISRSIVEDGVHLILQDRDVGWLRDMQRARALRSQRLSAEVKSFIGGTGRHVDREEEVVSSTTADGADRRKEGGARGRRRKRSRGGGEFSQCAS